MKRSGFSMIELVFVIVILGVLAAVAVPRFMATRTDAQVATLRSDAAATLKVIVAKVFADNIDTTQSIAPHPNDKTKTPKIQWSEWILEVAGLDGNRWMKASAIGDADKYGVSPIYKVGTYRMPCGLHKALISITKDGDLYFNPVGLYSEGAYSGMQNSNFELCKVLQKSYASSAGYGNKIIPLSSTQTIEF
ncbi:type II secretion system protein [Helicobacter sp. 23-1045]